MSSIRKKLFKKKENEESTQKKRFAKKGLMKKVPFKKVPFSFRKKKKLEGTLVDDQSSVYTEEPSFEQDDGSFNSESPVQEQKKEAVIPDNSERIQEESEQSRINENDVPKDEPILELSEKIPEECEEVINREKEDAETKKEENNEHDCFFLTHLFMQLFEPKKSVLQ